MHSHAWRLVVIHTLEGSHIAPVSPVSRVPCAPVIVRPFCPCSRVYLLRTPENKLFRANPYGIRLTADTCTLQANNHA